MHLDHALLTGAESSVVLGWGTGMPSVLHWGRRLSSFNTEAIARPVPRATLDIEPDLGLVVEESRGFSGRPGIAGHRADGTGWSPRFQLERPPDAGSNRARFDLVDPIAELGMSIVAEVTEADVLLIDARLTNLGTTPYLLQQFAPSLPMPARADELLAFTGRWCLEFQPHRADFVGLTAVENRRGRTSHDRLPAVICGTRGFGEQHGEVWSVQLAWSGNFSLAAEQVADGRRHVQAGALLAPAEIELEPGGSFDAPQVVGAWADSGLSALSGRHHAHVRAQSHWPRSPRPVMLNTWEAVYFDHDLDTLVELANAAAEVGVERFVLDDGWFGGRRDDTAGLGDWWVSPDAWPGGLDPLIDHVTSRGMEFGLWFEPEMVNPDSELFSHHPDWLLATDGYPPVEGRQQLVLDLGRSDVRDHLFDQISDVLTSHDISYVKWDMNRDVVQGSGASGRAGIHAFVLGLYELIDRLRAAHPDVEFESCSSGGGRADLGILARTERIWTSDSNDAVDRQAIQRGFSLLFPPEAMGSHIGPDVAHTTGRHQPLSFRLATALFGHLGIEWNLLTATASERQQVADGVALHKRLRSLLHTGVVVRDDHPDPSALVHGVVSADGTHAVFAYVQIHSPLSTVPFPMRFPGLEADRTYRVELLRPVSEGRHFDRTPPGWLDATSVAGAQLMATGLSVPVLHPQSVLMVEVTAE